MLPMRSAQPTAIHLLPFATSNPSVSARVPALDRSSVLVGAGKSLPPAACSKVKSKDGLEGEASLNQRGSKLLLLEVGKTNPAGQRA